MPETVVMETAAVAAAEKNRMSPSQEEQELQREYALAAERREKAIQLAQSGDSLMVRDARLIMGDNFIGLDFAIRRFGLVATSAEIDALEFVPYAEDTLYELKDSFILVALPPVDFVGIRQGAWKERKAIRGDFSYDEESFASRKMGVRWCLVSREIARNSLFHSKADQQKTVFANPSYERLGAAEMAYVITAHLLMTGQRIFRSVAALTSDSIFTLEKGRRKEWGVFVGFNDPEFGIAVGTCPADRPMTNIGAVVSVRSAIPMDDEPIVGEAVE